MSQQGPRKKTPLPPGWEAYPSKSCPGRVYFYDQTTNQSIWQSDLLKVFTVGHSDNVGLRKSEETSSTKAESGILTYVPTPIRPNNQDCEPASNRPTSPFYSPRECDLKKNEPIQDKLEPQINHLANLTNETFYADKSPCAFSQHKPTVSKTALHRLADSVIVKSIPLSKEESISLPTNSPYSGYSSHETKRSPFASPIKLNNTLKKDSINASSSVIAQDSLSNLRSSAADTHEEISNLSQELLKTLSNSPYSGYVSLETKPSPKPSPKFSISLNQRELSNSSSSSIAQDNPTTFIRRPFVSTSPNFSPLSNSFSSQNLSSQSESNNLTSEQSSLSVNSPSGSSDSPPQSPIFKRGTFTSEVDEEMPHFHNSRSGRPNHTLSHNRALQPPVYPEFMNGFGTSRKNENWRPMQPSPQPQSSSWSNSNSDPLRRQFNHRKRRGSNELEYPIENCGDYGFNFNEEYHPLDQRNQVGGQRDSSRNYQNYPSSVNNRTNENGNRNFRPPLNNPGIREAQSSRGLLPLPNYPPDPQYLPKAPVRSRSRSLSCSQPLRSRAVSVNVRLANVQQQTRLEGLHPPFSDFDNLSERFAPYSSTIPTPSEMIAQFSQERPDIVKLPNLSPVKDQSSNSKMSSTRKRIEPPPKDPVYLRHTVSNRVGKRCASDALEWEGNVQKSPPGLTNSLRREDPLKTSQNSSVKDIRKEGPFETSSNSSMKDVKREGSFDTSSNFSMKDVRREGPFKNSQNSSRREPSFSKPSAPLNASRVANPSSTQVIFHRRDSFFEKSSKLPSEPTKLNASFEEQQPVVTPIKSENISETPPSKKRVNFQEGHQEFFFEKYLVESEDYESGEEEQINAFEESMESNEWNDSSIEEESNNLVNVNIDGVKSKLKVNSSSQRAQNRLEKFRESLNVKTKDYPSPAKPEASSFNSNSASDSQGGVETKVVSTDEFLAPAAPPSSSLSCVSESISKVDADEPMEWEDVPLPKIISQVNETRLYLSTCLPKSTAGWAPEKEPSVTPVVDNFFIVLDTNILLSGLSFVSNLRDTKFKELGFPIIMIPWQVIQEIDSLKERQTAVQRKAIAAKNYLFDNFSNDHPRVRGQPMNDWRESLDPYHCPDDSILICAIKLKEKGKHVIFVSDDKHLITKSITHEIESYTQEQMQTKMKEEKEEVVRPAGDPCQGTVVEKTSNEVNELICALKTALFEYLSEIIPKGMIDCFGEKMWKKRVEIKPPWSTVTVCLRLLEKHHISIITEITPSKFSAAVKEVENFFVAQEKGKKMEVSSLMMTLKAINVALEYLKKDYSEETYALLNYLESFRKKLTAVGIERSPSKKIDLRKTPSPKSTPISISFPPSTSDFHPASSTPMTGAASTDTSRDETFESQPAMESMESTSSGNSAYSGNTAMVALNECYHYCKNFCGNMCNKLKVKHSLSDVAVIDKTLVDFREDLPELQAFVKDVMNSFQSIFDKKSNKQTVYHDMVEIIELKMILQSFLAENLNFGEVQIDSQDLTSIFFPPNLEKTEIGFKQLGDLRSLFLECSNEFKKLNIY